MQVTLHGYTHHEQPNIMVYFIAQICKKKKKLSYILAILFFNSVHLPSWIHLKTFFLLFVLKNVWNMEKNLHQNYEFFSVCVSRFPR